jgi:hypothetical protein
MKVYNLSKIICCVFLLVSITTLIQPVQSTTLNNKIKQIESLRKEINSNCINCKQTGLFESLIQKKDISQYGLISWLINFIKQLIDLLKRPFEKLSELFSKIASFFDQLRLLMEDIIALIDWIVRKAIIVIIISIIMEIIRFVQFIVDLIEESQEPEPSY